MADYIWTAGAHVKVSAQIVGQELEALQERHGGRVTARVVVDAARPEDSPLHPCFEWDNVRAAELYREEQARHVIACVRVVQEKNEAGVATKTMRAFVNLTETVGDDEQRAYIPIARVLSDADLLQQAMRQAAKELHSFEERYASFEAIAGIAHEARLKLEEKLAVEQSAA